jgi:hypothetical protein
MTNDQIPIKRQTRVPNDQAAMTNQAPMTNYQLVVLRHSSLIGHCDLVIGDFS